MDRGNGLIGPRTYILSDFDRDNKPILKDFQTGKTLDLQVLNIAWLVLLCIGFLLQWTLTTW